VAETRAEAGPASGGLLARSPLAFVAPGIWSAPAADAEIQVRAAKLRDKWTAVADALGSASAGEVDRLAEIRRLGELGVTLRPLAERGLGAAIDTSSPAAHRLQVAAAAHQTLVAAEGAAWEVAAGWSEPLSAADGRSALTVAQGKEGGLLAFLSGDWRRVKALVRSRFDTSDRAVRPSVTEILTTLVAAHDASAAVKLSAEEVGRVWGTDDPVGLVRRIQQFAQDPALVDWCAAVVADAGAAVAFAKVAAALDEAESSNQGFLLEPDLPLSGVLGITEALSSPGLVPAIQRLIPAMRELNEAPSPVQTAVRRMEATPEQLEYAVCSLHWERSRVAAPLQLTSARLDSIVGELSLVYDELTTLNAEVVVAGVRRRFLGELAHSEASVTGMSSEDRARKKNFSAGRRELEHEFGKVMRYKSIRDLASGARGEVVSRLRPIWLMSPSSVSDTLPLTTSFDVVIYDEASQIPVEEAIPALHRAPQVIVVGDQMQLPPTQYFRVQRVELDDEVAADAEAEQVGIALTDDSFLAISALRLASTMLTWHYRSRSEALISFSNAAFYQGRLATIPDRLPAHTAPPWTLRSDSPAIGEVCDSVLAGSITSVRLVDGVYVRRTNPAEARWIAGLVRELLGRETGRSIGVVAFSEAQQGEIERALDELGEADPEFGARYEAEQVRTRDEQDAGLFVKNLENVQGDERDIVIMSVCYAAGPDGRMLMNFGPINTAGGEKRLNVIFSRARRHMVVVASIEPDAITNTYNDGANTLRRFLTYANAISRGDLPAAQRESGVVSANAAVVRSGGVRAAVVEQVAEGLRGLGVVVESSVGESVFRCDLAVRLPGDSGHRLAVLVDTPARLASDSLLERLTTHPRALTTTGWRVHHVLTTDWTQNPEAVLTRLLDTLNRPIDE
ncbi:MAG TPA: AAA domain-containing protein, partial [Kribbella sp.]|uniref:AAA domain-containing protein n=1 Tax=Kribbella sp. TaxID=1871183 RepID=UPI002D798E1B